MQITPKDETRRRYARTVTRLHVSALAAALSSPVLAQTAPPEDVERPRSISPTAAGETRPVPLTGRETAVARRLLPEGAFLVNQRGRIRSLGHGWSAFVFAPNASGPSLPPMPLLPSTATQSMEQHASDDQRQIDFIINGQVFVYQGRNYLLPTVYSTAIVTGAEDEDAVVDTPQLQPTDPEEPPTLQGLFDDRRDSTRDPTVQELLEELEDLVERSRPSAAPEIVPTPSDAQTRLGLRREGDYIALRRGRLLAGADGRWNFVIDNDADGAAGVDAPMVIMPSLNLMRMEETLRRRGREVTFTVSGRVFVYEGRNHLLPTMFIADVDRGGNIATGQ